MEERLQKYMARCGIASRRKCEDIILQQRVSINGEIVKELGMKVNPNSDIIIVDNERVLPEEKKRYIMLNKPEGVISSVSDEKGRRTILDLVKVSERIYPIGRLDYDSSGLILLTNDGDVYNKVIHPRNMINKTYFGILEGIPNSEEINRFCTGIDIDGYITSNAEFKILKRDNEKCQAEMIIHEGKNRQIRKMCESIGHHVLELKRVSIGKIELSDLQEGSYRELTEEEIEYLKML